MTCHHPLCTCTTCGVTASPASLLASRPRIRSEAAREQSRAAGSQPKRPVATMFCCGHCGATTTQTADQTREYGYPKCCCKTMQVRA